MRCKYAGLAMVPWMAAWITVLTSSVAQGDSPPAFVVSVEEVWQLEVGIPNISANAPQVSMVMSTSDSVEGDFFMFLLNHRTHPNYVAGGMQTQHWLGSTIQEIGNGNEEDALTESSDVVTWTQRLSIDSGTVTFAVKNGSSSSWNDFGGNDDQLSHTVATGDANLNAYTPSVSVNQSGIGYAGNRVVSLTLQKVTWTLSDGQTHVTTAPIDIDADLDPWD